MQPMKTLIKYSPYSDGSADCQIAWGYHRGYWRGPARLFAHRCHIAATVPTTRPPVEPAKNIRKTWITHLWSISRELYTSENVIRTGVFRTRARWRKFRVLHAPRAPRRVYIVVESYPLGEWWGKRAGLILPLYLSCTLFRDWAGLSLMVSI